MDRTRVLIVEDEALIAFALAFDLEAAGLEVIGPYATALQAIAALETASIDVAILDVNVLDGYVFPVAEALERRGIPFYFATACDRSEIPGKFADVHVFAKPVAPERLVDTLVMCHS